MTLRKLYDMIKDEMEGSQKYQRHASDFRERGYPDVAIIFEKLAETEFKHAMWLKKVYEYFGGK